MAVAPGALASMVELSSVRASSSAAEVNEAVPVTITLRSADGAPIIGATPSLKSSRQADSIQPLSRNTNANGEAVFAVSAPTAGQSVFSAMYAGQTLAETALITFSSSTFSASVLSAQAVGAQAYNTFLRAELPSSIPVGQAVDLIISARSQTGELVADFAGSIAVSSTDASALLPNEYAFLPAIDAGSHTFARAVTFITPGTHTLTVVSPDPTTAPTSIAVEVIGAKEQIAPAVIDTPFNGDSINGSVSVSGSGPAFSDIAIIANDQRVQTTSTNDSGAFFTTLTLEDGAYALAAAAIIGEGIGPVSETISITVDTTKPIVTAVRIEPQPQVELGDTALLVVEADEGLNDVEAVIGQGRLSLFEISPGRYEGDINANTEGEYLISVVARDKAGNTTEKENAAAIIVSMSPSLTVKAQGKNQAVELSWPAPNNTTDIANYVIRYGTIADNLTETVTTQNSNPQATINKLQNGTTYYFVVSAVAADEKLLHFSESVSAVPESILGLTLSPCSGGLALSWRAAGGADIAAYAVMYGPASREYTERVVAEPGTLNVTLGNLINGMSYYLTVYGLDERGEVAFYTDEEVVGIPGGGACLFAAREAPITLVEKEDENGEKYLSWNPVAGAQTYRVYAGTSPNSFDLPVVEVATPFFKPVGLSENASYYFAVRAVVAGKESSQFSNLLELEVGPPLALMLAGAGALGIMALRRRKK